MHIPLYEPLNTLKPIGQGIWIADGDLIQMSVGCGSLPFSTRMTVVQLADGSLWCHSPIAPNESLFQALDSLGPVAHLVSPNKIHYAYMIGSGVTLKLRLGVVQVLKSGLQVRKSL